MAERLYTSQKTDEIFRALRYDTKLEFNVLAKMAFFLSVSQSNDEVTSVQDFSGKEIKRSLFLGADELFIRALLSLVYKRSEFSEEEFYSNKSFIKYHIDNGANILKELYDSNQSSLFFSKLLEYLDLTSFKNKNETLDIFIGRKLLRKEEIILELNNTTKHANSHLAIMGKPGVGKTQFLLKILTDIRTQSNYQVNFIFFDYKGDVVDNNKFVELTRARTYRLLKDNEGIPINPFILPSYDSQSVLVSAREKAESFASINSKLGVVQKGTLSDAIQIAYERRQVSNPPCPDFHDVGETVLEIYQSQNRKDDSLIEVLRDLSQFNLFWEHGNAAPPLENLSNKTMIVDVHHMPVLKELVAYLVIERLYKEMAALPDSEIRDGRRLIRTILVIDEAHNYLPQKNIFLQRIIREGRSKGVVVFFASQSPNDYQQNYFNFQELLEFAFVFQCEGVSYASVQDILGCSQKAARELQSEIARLEPFQVIMKGTKKGDEFYKFVAESFYKNYQ
ncbi:MAG: DndE family protein [Leptospiraceae bacterium]|nr:DndE family protein [Leptospiraceae bacterium]